MATFTRRLAAAAGAAGLLSLLAGSVVPAAAHNLDHPFVTQAPPGSTPSTNALQGAGDWRMVASIPTGNPHTDLDFFTQDGNRFVSVGTLAVGANGGGQTIVQLTDGDQLAPRLVSGHGSAACLIVTSSATGLQHDVEATPKGDVLFNTAFPNADRRDAQLLLDSTDQNQRCHDNGNLGASAAPDGGIEIIDITDVTNPAEIALISIWQDTHTLNVDPKRPHIAVSAGQDNVTISNRAEADGGGTEASIDGLHFVDLSSCMDFPAGTTISEKREACRPEVYRWRYPSPDWARGTWDDDVNQACHEMEFYPDDTITCAGINGTFIANVAGMFDDMGTPNDFTDDKIIGDPLPCPIRSSTSIMTPTGAPIVDCAVADDGSSMDAPWWVGQGAPGIDGIELVGFVNHAGGLKVLGGAVPPFTAADDVFAAHEAELTHSGKFLLVSDESGGASVPPFASCGVPNDQNPSGNGGMHAFAVDRLFTEYPEGGDYAARKTLVDEVYAKDPAGDLAVFRAEVRIPTPGAFCTAHVFQQIPGQNRIFMAWYTQGTQVVDYIEHEDGTFEWVPVTYFIPENAIEWTSQVFDFVENEDGSFTYWGVAGDFGRASIDVYEVTLPAPAQMTGTFEPVAPEPAPTPAPAPEPEPEPAPLPATGAGALGVLAGLGMLNAGLLIRRRRD